MSAAVDGMTQGYLGAIAEIANGSREISDSRQTLADLNTQNQDSVRLLEDSIKDFATSEA